MLRFNLFACHLHDRFINCQRKFSGLRHVNKPYPNVPLVHMMDDRLKMDGASENTSIVLRGTKVGISNINFKVRPTICHKKSFSTLTCR